MPKLLTLDDLYDYYSSTSVRKRSFNSKNDDDALVVQTFGKVTFDSDYDAREGLTPVKLESCHIDLNDNRFEISEDVMNAAKDSIVFRPIMGFIHKVDGQWEFYEHNRHKENGELVYDESPIGVITNEVEPYLAYNEEKNKTYLNVEGYLYDDYSHATEILMREKTCSVSVEIWIKKSEFDVKRKVLVVNEFVFGGVTILGKDPDGNDISPGMAGSEITLKDFSAKNNSMFSKGAEDKLFEMLETLNENISNFNKYYNSGKEETQKVMNKFEELLAKYNVTAEAVTFDYSGLSDEELEAKFMEVFDGEDGGDSGDNGDAGEGSDNSGEDNGNGDNDPSNTSDSDNGSDSNNSEEGADESGESGDGVDGSEESSKKSFLKTFELSHNDIRSGLYALIPTEAWISEVYDTHFIYEIWDETNGGYKYFNQKYISSEDSIALDGDPVEVFSMFVTADEKKFIETARANYTAVVEELAKFKSEPEKQEIFKADEWKVISETAEFAELSKQENHFNLSKEEITDKLNEMVLTFAKANPDKITTFAKKENDHVAKGSFVAFAGISHGEEENDFLQKLVERANGGK